MKLKTLKDFDEGEHKWGKGRHRDDCIACERNETLIELKEEAVKWVNSSIVDEKKMKAFFNITDDDLKLKGGGANE